MSLLNTISIAAVEHISSKVGPMCDVFDKIDDVVVINVQSRYVAFKQAINDAGYELTNKEHKLLFMVTAEVCMLHARDMADTMGANSYAAPTLVQIMTTELSVLSKYSEVTNISDHIDTAYEIVMIAEAARLDTIIDTAVHYLPVGWTETTGSIYVHLGKIKQGESYGKY